MTENKELAKSWFQLAIVLATLAGMLVVASGVFYPKTSELISSVSQISEVCTSSLSLNSSMVNSTSYDDCLSSNFKEIKGLIVGSYKAFGWLIILAILFSLNSFCSWFIGYRKLKNEDFESGF